VARKTRAPKAPKPLTLAQISNQIKKDSKASNGYVTSAQTQGYLDKGTYTKDQLSQAASQVYKNPNQVKGKGIAFTGDALDSLGINKTYYQPEYEKGGGAAWNMQQGPLLDKKAGYAWERAPVVTPQAPEDLTQEPEELQQPEWLKGMVDSMNASMDLFSQSMAKEPPKPEFQSSSGASLAGNATGFRAAKSSWRKSGQSSKGSNNLTIKQTPVAKNVGLNITG
jgi:hypothetical protein